MPYVASVAFVVHASRLGELFGLLWTFRQTLSGMHLAAAKGALPMFDEFGLPVKEVLGVTALQAATSVGRRVLRGSVNGVVLLGNPYSAASGEPGVEGMLALCDQQQVPLATNLASAQILLLFFSDWEFDFPPPPRTRLRSPGGLSRTGR